MSEKTKSELFDGSLAVQEQQRVKAKALNVPARILLNDAGVSFFLKHRQITHRFIDSEGETRFGFKMENMDFQWLKKMLLKGFVEKLEIRIFDIAGANSALNDAIRLVFFSIFRHRISLSVLEYMYNSPMLRSWNRANPKKSIGPGVRISKQVLHGTLENHRYEIEYLQMELRQMILGRVNLVRTKWDDEKSLRNFISEIIRDFDPFILFILVGSPWDDRLVLLKNIASQILAFANMVDALDMASVLSIELVSAAERSALQRVMEKNKIHKLVEDLPQLKSILKAESYRGTTMVVSIPRYTPGNRSRLKFRFSFYNDVVNADAERKLMEDFTERSTLYKAGKNLDDYWGSSGSAWDDNALRFYYLNMLRELCGRHNIMMESRINTAGDSTVTSLLFGF
jgi:hypothetical protein